MKAHEAINYFAQKEGWSLFLTNSPGDRPPYELQRTELPRFKDDAQAIRHVVKMAKDGSAVHISALEFLNKESEQEMTHIMTVVDQVYADWINDNITFPFNDEDALNELQLLLVTSADIDAKIWTAREAKRVNTAIMMACEALKKMANQPGGSNYEPTLIRLYVSDRVPGEWAVYSNKLDTKVSTINAALGGSLKHDGVPFGLIRQHINGQDYQPERNG